jgi:hypothetical protein
MKEVAVWESEGKVGYSPTRQAHNHMFLQNSKTALHMSSSIPRPSSLEVWFDLASQKYMDPSDNFTAWQART